MQTVYCKIAERRCQIDTFDDCTECSIRKGKALGTPHPLSSTEFVGSGFSLDSVIAEKARPVDMRKALHVADEFKKAGILFVPMPVLNKKDGDELCTESFKRMGILERKAVLEA